MVMLRWQTAIEPVDGGMPADVGLILATGLTRSAQVTFFSTERPPPAGGDWTAAGGDVVRKVRLGLAERLRFRGIGWTMSLAQISSRNPESVAALFDDGGLPWWTGAQAAILSSADQPPPEVDATRFLMLLNEDWSAAASALGGSGVRAVLRAGVDGDVAGLLTLAPAYQATLLGSLRSAAEEEGFDWIEQDEPSHG